MEAIVLAGGFGTRLQHVVSDVPKPMAPINDKPFLKYVLDYLIRNGVNHTVLAVGYKADKIKSYFGNHYNGIKLSYSFEDVPLGTGGAIKKALSYCNDDNIIIINGDTFYDVNINKMLAFHLENSSKLTVAVKPMQNFERYGSVLVENNVIKGFEEKKPTISGIINGGTYILQKSIFKDLIESSFSFENVILENKDIKKYAFISATYFIDIGIPEDYYKAQKEFINF